MGLCEMPSLVLNTILDYVDPFSIPQLMRTCTFMNYSVSLNRHRMRKVMIKSMFIYCMGKNPRIRLEIEGRATIQIHIMKDSSTATTTDEEDGKEEVEGVEFLMVHEPSDLRIEESVVEKTLKVHTRRSVEGKFLEVLDHILKEANVGILKLENLPGDMIFGIASQLAVNNTLVRELWFIHTLNYFGVFDPSSLCRLVASLQGTETIHITGDLTTELFTIPQLVLATEKVELLYSRYSQRYFPLMDRDFLALSAKRIIIGYCCNVTTQCMRQVIEEWMAHKREIGVGNPAIVLKSPVIRWEMLRGIECQWTASEVLIKRDDHQTLVLNWTPYELELFVRP